MASTSRKHGHEHSIQEDRQPMEATFGLLHGLEAHRGHRRQTLTPSSKIPTTVTAYVVTISYPTGTLLMMLCMPHSPCGVQEARVEGSIP